MLHRRLLHGDVGVWWFLFLSFVDWHRVLQRECGMHTAQAQIWMFLFSFLVCFCLLVSVVDLQRVLKRGVGCRGCTDVYLEQVGDVQKQLLPPPAAAATAPSHHHCPVIAPVLAFSEQIVFPVILTLRLFTCHVFWFQRGGVKTLGICHRLHDLEINFCPCFFGTIVGRFLSKSAPAYTLWYCI